jgi:hypothetical protein
MIFKLNPITSVLAVWPHILKILRALKAQYFIHTLLNLDKEED